MDVSTFVPGLFGLLGVAVGGVVQYFTTTKQDDREREFQEKRLAGAFLGEISALRKIILFRGYLNHVDGNIARLSNGENAPLVWIPAKRSYDAVFRANIERLGMLPMPIPEKLATLYTVMSSMLDDMDNRGVQDTTAWPVEVRLAAERDLHTLLTSFITLSESLIADLSEICGPAHYQLVDPAEEEATEQTKEASPPSG